MDVLVPKMWFQAVLVSVLVTLTFVVANDWPLNETPRLQKLGFGKAVNMNHTRLWGIEVSFHTNILSSRNVSKVNEYKGIQYSLVEWSSYKFRFMRAKNPVRAASHVIHADRFKPVCPQLNEFFFRSVPESLLQRRKGIASFTQSQSEDCLWLNLYVPEEKGTVFVLLFTHVLLRFGTISHFLC